MDKSTRLSEEKYKIDHRTLTFRPYWSFSKLELEGRKKKCLNFGHIVTVMLITWMWKVYVLCNSIMQRNEHILFSPLCN